MCTPSESRQELVERKETRKPHLISPHGHMNLGLGQVQKPPLLAMISFMLSTIMGHSLERNLGRSWHLPLFGINDIRRWSVFDYDATALND